MRLPREALARRLGTTHRTIEDLENGALSSLPHWRETVRIVRGYCEIAAARPAADSLAHADPVGQCGLARPDPPTAVERYAPAGSADRPSAQGMRQKAATPRGGGAGRARCLP